LEAAPLTVPRDAVQRFASVLQSGRVWMLLLGWVLIVVGVLEALSIVGLVIAWLLIWTGIVLIQAAERVAEAARSGEAEALLAALSKIRLYFVINGVLVLVGIVLVLIGFLFFASFMGAMMTALHGGMSGAAMYHP
jgi:hypothetical protein